MAVLKTQDAERSLFLRVKADFLEVTTKGDVMLFKNASWKHPRDAIECLEFNMAASVFQDRMLTEPMGSMAVQTDVEMAKEERGRMMST